MKFELHYTIDGCEDFLLVEGSSIEEVRKKCDKEIEKRGLDLDRNNIYTMQLGED